MGPRDKLSWSWRNLLKIRSCIRDSFYVQIGNGKNTSMWFDNWHQLGPLSYVLSHREIACDGFNIRDKVSDVIVNNDWRWPMDWLRLIPQLGEFPIPKLSRDKKDVVLWMNWKRDVVPFLLIKSHILLFVMNQKLFGLIWSGSRIEFQVTVSSSGLLFLKG